jgi:hypothetical protein
MNAAPWIFLFLGIATIIFGIKKIVDDALKISIINEERMKMYQKRQPPYQPPTQQQP